LKYLFDNFNVSIVKNILLFIKVNFKLDLLSSVTLFQNLIEFSLWMVILDFFKLKQTEYVGNEYVEIHGVY